MRALTLNQYTATDTFARTYDAGGNAARIAREALVGEAWVPLTWEERAYSATHRHVGSTFSNGKAADAVGMTTFGYNADGRKAGQGPQTVPAPSTPHQPPSQRDSAATHPRDGG